MTGVNSVSGTTLLTGWRWSSRLIAPCPITVDPSAEKRIQPKVDSGNCGTLLRLSGSKT